MSMVPALTVYQKIRIVTVYPDEVMVAIFSQFIERKPRFSLLFGGERGFVLVIRLQVLARARG